MRPDDKDMARLWDILEASRSAIEFTNNLQYQQFLEDRKTRYAVERCLEVIGEATRCLSQEIRDVHSDIPWSSIIALRNIIAHDYGEILYEKIWRVCKDRLPPLINWVEALGVDDIPQEEDG